MSSKMENRPKNGQTKTHTITKLVLTSRYKANGMANGIANAAKAMEKETDFQIRVLWPA